MATGTIYFHSPCFDGIVSAVLVWDFLEQRDGWVGPVLVPVNYDARPAWARQWLKRPNAVVDFLYHPRAGFWADHHATAFLTPEMRDDFERRGDGRLIYDAGAGSCAALLWDRLYKQFTHRNQRYQELIEWADKIDAARYSSVDEAMSSEPPALRIVRGLSLGCSGGYCERLVEALREGSLDEAAAAPERLAHLDEAERLAAQGWVRLRNDVHLDDQGVAVYDVDAQGVLVNRYAAFRAFPQARYSAGILRHGDVTKVTVMRNPWREFPSPSLGRIAERLGGGGHHRIGSINLYGDRTRSARDILTQFLNALRLAEASASAAPR
jgi:hypothetical protein